MKLLRYGPAGHEKPGLLDKTGQIRDLSGTISDLSPDNLAPAALDRLRKLDPASLPLVAGESRIGPCVAQVSKLVCVGLNYTDHARETGSPIPKEPILFMKATTSITGPNDDVMLPKSSVKGDWEVELGIVIGAATRYVSVHDAFKHIAGYCLVNDVSEREFQIERSGQWTKGKSADTFCPLGPWMVTADEIPDPQALDLFCAVNGKTMQRGTTANMIFPVAHLVSYISHFMTLLPGDVIPTGTPAGVGLGMKPTPVFLKPGDTMHLGVTGLGEQRQKVVGFRE
ncbi:MAG: fumarylacetoacetate hydrolase family protein [Rhodospirillales bacterium]|jgi:2-keto-4-pentenoate hydratase/2-oxohepta-3-ene-1,7-dioic acid hydratase in catechol pathway|nr:fumarylacetoacetate hydrolase family protein [Rhodospirillales bacterium]